MRIRCKTTRLILALAPLAVAVSCAQPAPDDPRLSYGYAPEAHWQQEERARRAEAWERQRQRNPSELFSPEFLADLRTGVLTSTRRAGILVDPASVKVVAEGGLVRVSVGWTYRTEPVKTWGFDTAVPVPLWLGRSFDPQLGSRRIF